MANGSTFLEPDELWLLCDAAIGATAHGVWIVNVLEGVIQQYWSSRRPPDSNLSSDFAKKCTYVWIYLNRVLSSRSSSQLTETNVSTGTANSPLTFSSILLGILEGARRLLPPLWRFIPYSGSRIVLSSGPQTGKNRSFLSYRAVSVISNASRSHRCLSIMRYCWKGRCEREATKLLSILGRR